MEELKQLLASMVGGEDDYFKEVVFGSDPNTFAVSIDEVETLPAIGCLAMRAQEVDITGKSCIAFQLFFVIKRDEEATAEEWDAQLSELDKEMHCFLGRLRPAVWRYPNRFNHFSDHALSGYWVDLTASATTLGECIDCQPPTPEGEYYDYLRGVTGLDNYNIFYLPNITNFEGKTLKIRGRASDSGNAGVNVWLQRVGAWTRIDPTGATLQANVVYDYVYTYLDSSIDITITNVATGAVAETSTAALGHGTSRHNGYLIPFWLRTQKNSRVGYIYSIILTGSDGVDEVRLRPYKTASGVVGLKDEISGDFFAPQQNVSITVGNVATLTLAKGAAPEVESKEEDETWTQEEK